MDYVYYTVQVPTFRPFLFVLNICSCKAPRGTIVAPSRHVTLILSSQPIVQRFEILEQCTGIHVRTTGYRFHNLWPRTRPPQLQHPPARETNVC